jgi:hypothetical protein
MSANSDAVMERSLMSYCRPDANGYVSTITLFDGSAITEIDVLPASASRGL